MPYQQYKSIQFKFTVYGLAGSGSGDGPANGPSCRGLTYGLASVNGNGGLERGPHGVGVDGDSGSWWQTAKGDVLRSL